MRSPALHRAAVFLACPIAGTVLGYVYGLPGLGFTTGILVGGGAVLLLERATDRDHRITEERRRVAALGRALPDPVHRVVIAGARVAILEHGWSRMAPHGRSDNPHTGLCAKAAVQHAAAAVISSGGSRDPRLADQVLMAFGQWIEDHGMSPPGWSSGATHGYGAMAPWWNDAQMSREWVLAVFALAAGTPRGDDLVVDGEVVEPLGLPAPSGIRWEDEIRRSVREHEYATRRYWPGGAR